MWAPHPDRAAPEGELPAAGHWHEAGTFSGGLRCYLHRMAAEDARIHLILDEDLSARLSRIAARAHTNGNALAHALLGEAVSRHEPGSSAAGLAQELEGDAVATDVVEILDRIPGAWESIARGREDARAGRTIPLADLL